MIVVDIQVPNLNRTYDFELDEEMKTDILIKKIIQTITEKERLKDCEGNDMLLFDLSRETVLSGNCSLKQQGVKSGAQLFLI